MRNLRTHYASVTSDPPNVDAQQLWLLKQCESVAMSFFCFGGGGCYPNPCSQSCFRIDQENLIS
jgi:hypothetical protein